MIKYKDEHIVFEEIPDMVSLALNITGCQNNCIGCHSPELRADMGIELTEREVDRLIRNNVGINCFLFMGEGKDQEALLDIARYVKNIHDINISIYSGREEVENVFYELFDYVKVGPYKEEFGPLNKKTTNQRLYKCKNGKKEDITYLMWK